jgi:hypothetical protein
VQRRDSSSTQNHYETVANPYKVIPKASSHDDAVVSHDGDGAMLSSMDDNA